MALSADRNNVTATIDCRDIVGTIKNAVTVHEGGWTAADDDGLVPTLSTTAGLRHLGWCIRSDGLGDAGGTKKAIVRRRGTVTCAIAAATAADLGKKAYIVDDETVQTTPPSQTGGYDYIAGEIVEVVSSTLVRIDVEKSGAQDQSKVSVQSVELALGTISATATFNIIVPPFAGVITGIAFACKDAIAANDTNYWTFGVVNKGAAGNGTTAVVDAANDANSTKATGGSAITGYVKRNLTLAAAANRVVAAGDVLEITITKASSATTMTQCALRLDVQPNA